LTLDSNSKNQTQSSHNLIKSPQPIVTASIHRPATTAMSVWNPDNIRDVAESVGAAALNDDVLQALASDVEYRLSQILGEALKFMRQARRSVLSTQDVSQALRALDIEPLYGYDSTRPLRFGEASIGPGQPLFYVEDEEVDFEKVINTPLPKVPRDVTFTAHWLAVEGVQPSIPQNPTLAESRHQELMPKGTSANPNLAAISGHDVTVKPQVKHILSKELQLYFEKVSSALLDEANDEYRLAALASVRSDPGLHQLVPYFVQFIAEKVTHGLKSLFVLHQMLDLADAMLANSTLHLAPYIASLVPSLLTCLISARLGASSNPLEHYALRNKAASILGLVAKKYNTSAHTLKPRLVRTCLKYFLEPKKPLAVHYGAIRGIAAIGGKEAVRVLLVPNLKDYGVLIQEGLAGGPPGDKDAEMVAGAVEGALLDLEDEGLPLMNGFASGDVDSQKEKLEGKVGPLWADRIVRMKKPGVMQAVMES
jgi:transcription initiation factor TFIID subunit 6